MTRKTLTEYRKTAVPHQGYWWVFMALMLIGDLPIPIFLKYSASRLNTTNHIGIPSQYLVG